MSRKSPVKHLSLKLLAWAALPVIICCSAAKETSHGRSCDDTSDGGHRQGALGAVDWRGITKVEFKQCFSGASKSGKHLPWTLSIEPPGLWSFDINWLGYRQAWFDPSRTVDSNRVIASIHDCKLLERDKAWLGMGIPDYPSTYIAVTTQSGAHIYHLGSMYVVERYEPESLEFAIGILEVWRELARGLVLPPEAEQFDSDIEKSILLYRQKLAEVRHPREQ